MTQYLAAALDVNTLAITPAGGASDTIRTEYGYDSAGRQNVVSDNLGRETHTVYDALGRVVRSLYDDDGQIIVTDTIPIDGKYEGDRVKVLSSARIFAEAIQQIHKSANIVRGAH